MNWNSSGRRQELPPNWKAIRRKVLERDGFQCTATLDSGRRCPERATDVDHIRRGNDHRPSNLRSLCGPCHKRKTQSEGYHAMRRKQMKRVEREFGHHEEHPGKIHNKPFKQPWGEGT